MHFFLLDTNVSQALAQFEITMRLKKCASNIFLRELLDMNTLEKTPVDPKASGLW